MSEAFLKGTLTYLPKAEITFDRYHIKSHLSKAVDEVRREEVKHHRELLSNTRYMWLKRPANLTDRQRDLLDELLAQPLDTVRRTRSPSSSTASMRSMIPRPPRSTCAAGSPRSKRPTWNRCTSSPGCLRITGLG